MDNGVDRFRDYPINLGNLRNTFANPGAAPMGVRFLG
jgi:hypothetical protein